jgi:hypothetical protein
MASPDAAKKLLRDNGVVAMPVSPKVVYANNDSRPSKRSQAGVEQGGRF